MPGDGTLWLHPAARSQCRGQTRPSHPGRTAAQPWQLSVTLCYYCADSISVIWNMFTDTEKHLVVVITWSLRLLEIWSTWKLFSGITWSWSLELFHVSLWVLSTPLKSYRCDYFFAKYPKIGQLIARISEKFSTIHKTLMVCLQFSGSQLNVCQGSALQGGFAWGRSHLKCKSLQNK